MIEAIEAGAEDNSENSLTDAQKYALFLSAMCNSAQIADESRVFLDVHNKRENFSFSLDDETRWDIVKDSESNRNVRAVRIYEVEGDKGRDSYHFQRTCRSHFILRFDTNGELIELIDIDALRMRADGVFGYQTDYWTRYDMTQNPILPQPAQDNLRRYIDAYKEYKAQNSETNLD
jgi:hypothetical protein